MPGQKGGPHVRRHHLHALAVPSSEQFYWFELEVFQREHMKHFIRDILGKIANASGFNSYKYVFIDCPPNLASFPIRHSRPLAYPYVGRT
jgi:cellulose biosynthesis protein BcsQ